MLASSPIAQLNRLVKLFEPTFSIPAHKNFISHIKQSYRITDHL